MTNLNHYDELSAKEAGRMAAMAKFNGFTNEQIQKQISYLTSKAEENVISKAREYYTTFTQEIASHPASKNNAYVAYAPTGWIYAISTEGMDKSAAFAWVLRATN